MLERGGHHSHLGSCNPSAKKGLAASSLHSFIGWQLKRSTYLTTRGSDPQTDSSQTQSNARHATVYLPGGIRHARRKHVDAVKVNAKDIGSARVVALMDELFAIDRMAREKQMSHAERHVLRLERAPAVLDELRSQLIAIQTMALPKSAAGQAANYTLSLWTKLTQFLKYPELELSNNLAENSMRPVSIGRRDWLHMGSKEAGPKIAAIFSVDESCRRLNIPIRRYLADILPGLANRSIQSLAELTPAAYAARIAQ